MGVPGGDAWQVSNAFEVGNVVRAERARQGLTQAQLAERAHVSRDWVVRMEKGSPRLEVGLVFDVLAALGLQLTSTRRPTPGDGPDDDPFAGLVPAGGGW